MHSADSICSPQTHRLPDFFCVAWDTLDPDGSMLRQSINLQEDLYDAWYPPFAQFCLKQFRWQNTPKIMQWQHSIAFPHYSHHFQHFSGVEMVLVFTCFLPWFTSSLLHVQVMFVLFPIQIAGPFLFQVPPCYCRHWIRGYVAHLFP